MRTLGPLSAFYYTILSGRNLLFRLGLKKVNRLPSKVISIGNLTLGGTGKTPATIAIAMEALKRGLRPCILTRGYKGKAKGPCFVSKGDGPLMDCREAGDEPILMADRLNSVPIVKCADRYKGGMFALSSLQRSNAPFLFILDDGFQHISLYRDVNILLIDAVNPFGNKRLFPEGILREPLKAMERADIIVITKTETGDINSGAAKHYNREIEDTIRLYNNNATVYRAFYKPLSLISIAGNVEPLEFINGKGVYAFAGIANPSSFKASLTTIGANIVKFRAFRDHHPYNYRDIKLMKEEASGLTVITTEKDLVRIRPINPSWNILALRIDFSIGEDFYDRVLS